MRGVRRRGVRRSIPRLGVAGCEINPRSVGSRSVPNAAPYLRTAIAYRIEFEPSQCARIQVNCPDGPFLYGCLVAVNTHIDQSKVLGN